MDSVNPNGRHKNGTLRSYFITIQKIALYETKNRFYLVGSNLTETKFRILKIDRTEQRELVLVEDQASYNAKEIKELLSTIACVNRPRNPSKLVPTVSAFGILGFIQFLEGYYIILITKRRVVATIGYHSIYKIEDTACIYLPSEGPSKNLDELRYLKLFQSIDLSSNFYFTYSYDLTNSLQYNIAPPKHLVPGYKSYDFEPYTSYGISSQVNRKFVWNNYLLEPMQKNLRSDWILPVTHGFVGQSNICIYGKPIYCTLIARRSSLYAGTRFLKRGSNFDGNTANEVETEQIVFDSCVASFTRGHFTSFVQMRGSIPVHWSQDISKMVPKPLIGLDLADPYAETAGKHFGELLARFGSPIVVLNLVKKRERKKHESTLTEEFVSAIRTLNQFLPTKHRITYVGFDMARTNKMKEENVMAKLAGISEEVFRKTGFFHSKGPLYSYGSDKTIARRQTGLVRVNCVDCLDRTNTAQFALGKCALAHQLRALGVLSDDVDLEFDTDTIRMLEVLFEDHGDTLALQYGGSQLVHRINTYRKTAPWTSEGNDIMQTLSRYYSNTFSDADKQNAINLFLGVYRPATEQWPLWTLESDVFLHLKPEYRFANKPRASQRPLTEWYSDAVLNALPYSAYELAKTCTVLPFEDSEGIDCFCDFYRPMYFIPLQDIFAFKIAHSVRDFMPNFTTDYSPFSVRIRPGKRQEEINNKKANKIISLKNPSIMGLSSASSQTSTSSDTDYSSSEEMSSSMTSGNYVSQTSGGRMQHGGLVFSKFFCTMKESYGVEIKSPRKSDILLYRRFVNFQQLPCSSPAKTNFVPVIPLSGFSKDSVYKVTPPAVSRFSRDVYRNYVQRGNKGASNPPQRDLLIYSRYVSKSGDPLQKARDRK